MFNTSAHIAELEIKIRNWLAIQEKTIIGIPIENM